MRAYIEEDEETTITLPSPEDAAYIAHSLRVHAQELRQAVEDAREALTEKSPKKAQALRQVFALVDVGANSYGKKADHLEDLAFLIEDQLA